MQIAVLPPIPTLGWTAGDLDKHVHEVRRQYLATLADWPSRGSGPVEVTEPQPAGAAPGGPARLGHRRRR